MIMEVPTMAKRKKDPYAWLDAHINDPIAVHNRKVLDSIRKGK